MNLETDRSPKAFLQLFSGYRGAVEALTNFSRLLWNLAFREKKLTPPLSRGQTARYIFLREPDLHERADQVRTESGRDALDGIIKRLLDAGLAHRYSDHVLGFTLPSTQPIWLGREVLQNVKPDHELRYTVMRCIRQHHHCVLSSRTAQLFHLLGERLNRQLAEHRNSAARALREYDELLRFLASILDENPGVWDDSIPGAELFLECCRAVNYLRADYTIGRVRLRTLNVDAEYMLSHLFGLSTGIQGFDELFGGGGLTLVDEFEPATAAARITGRTVLAMGRYATGKSSLALQVALEVATKGGLAWFMPLEQSSEECLYALRTMCTVPNDGSVVIATDTWSAQRILQERKPDQGALVFLRTIKESFEHFLSTFQANVDLMRLYPLRLIVVDPINAILREKSMRAERHNMLRMFDDAKRSGANVWLTAEEAADQENESVDAQNIADTVIHLTLDGKYGYSQRYIEITKSRLQREQRGRHPYTIVPGEGITIYPSCAAVSERIRSRRITSPPHAEFGVPAIDNILGPNALRGGDIVVLEGPGGAMKTPLGLMFLLSGKREDAGRICNLHIGARDEDANVEWLMRQDYLKSYHRDFRKRGNLRFCSLRGGYIHPGYILQRIEHELHEAWFERMTPDRVMIDNVAHWETSCPFVRDDETFGDTLVELLRRYGLTSLLICSRGSTHGSSALQQTLIDNADCVIQFDRVEFRGAYHLFLRVLKTRGMKHRREWFELTLDANGIDVRPSASLLRILPDGEVSPVGIRLFLHSEIEMQREYNENVLHTVRSVLLRHASMESQTRIYMENALTLAASSAIDEMQVLQLDEFQVPRYSSGEQQVSKLYRFNGSDSPWKDWNDFFPRFIPPGGVEANGFTAVPYYQNVSLLAYRQDKVPDPQVLTSWSALADASDAWTKMKGSDDPDVFFDYPRATPENYNSLFLEILLSLMPPPADGPACRLQDWLMDIRAHIAAGLFHRLCRPAYLAQSDIRRTPGHEMPLITMNAKALVWRTWYSTLNQLLSGFSPADRLQVDVIPLPENVSIAGEWYLAVPAHSAAPDMGLKVITFLTSREAELDRVKLGVGLPTRRSFYRSRTEPIKSRISPYFSMDLNVLSQLVANAFPRSSFDCYSQVSGVLASHLQSVIEIDPEHTEVAEEIRKIFSSLQDKVAFMRDERRCAGCPNPRCS